MNLQNRMYLGCPFTKKTFSTEISPESTEVECPFCSRKHGISFGDEKTLEELQRSDKAIPKYIDYWTYGPEKVRGSIKINGTFFGSNVVYFTGNDNWMACNPDTVMFSGDRAGIPFEVWYKGQKKGDTKYAKVVDKDIDTFWGIRQKKDGTAEIVNDIRRAKYRKDASSGEYRPARFKSSCGKPFSQEIGRTIFEATYYSWIFSGKKKTTDEGETLEYELEYSVTEGKPSLKIEFTEAHTKEGSDTVCINGENITVATLSVLANGLGHQQVSSKKEGDRTGVQWFLPTDWKDISRLEDASNITNAVYMWWGEGRKNRNDIYLYVGIVGARSKEHSVYERITEEMKSGIASTFDIEVKQFRYSMMKSPGGESFPEILKTVEMQTINSISAIIPVHGNGDETIIKPFLGKADGGYADHNLYFASIGDSKRIILINREVRYHNS